MSHVWHLVRHDLRAHRTILLTWLAPCVGHPLWALVPWSRQAEGGFALPVAVMLVFARVVLGVVAIAAVVQAASPVDDRAFWRTRPVPSRLLAIAHLVTVVTLFVIVPTLVALVITASLGLPTGQWLRVLTHVFVMELALTSLALVMATRTRTTATFLIGVVVVIGVVIALPVTADALNRTLIWPMVHRPLADQWYAMAAATVLGALVLPWVFVLAMAGPRRQALLVVVSLVALGVSTGLWFHPDLRPAPRPIEGVRLAAEPQSVRVVEVPGSPGVRALVLDVVPESGRPDDAWRVTLEEGTLRTPGGIRRLAAGGAIHGLPGIGPTAVTAVLALLGADEHRRLVGSRATLDAIVRSYVERRPTEGSAVLADGAAITTDHAHFGITHVRRAGTYGDGSLGLAVQVTEVVLEPLLRARHDHNFVLRDSTSGCEVPVSPRWFGEGRRVMRTALLPSLSRPFEAASVTLVAGQAPSCTFDAGRAHIDVRTFDYHHAPSAAFSLEFVMPAAGRAFVTGGAPRQAREARPASVKTADRITQGGTA